MGISLSAKGYTGRFHWSYGSFALLRRAMVLELYGERMYKIYSVPFTKIDAEISMEDMEYWNSHCDKDLDMFLMHSDCSGFLYSGVCKKILKKLKASDIHIFMSDPLIHEYDGPTRYMYNSMYQELLRILEYCAENKHNLIFS